MNYAIISGSSVHLTTGALTPAVSVMANGMGSMFSIFMQFLPAIFIIGIVLFIISKLSGFKMGGNKGKQSFTTTIKN